MCVCLYVRARVCVQKGVSKRAHVFAHVENGLRGSLGSAELARAAAPTSELPHAVTVPSLRRSRPSLFSWGRGADSKAEV